MAIQQGRRSAATVKAVVLFAFCFVCSISGASTSLKELKEISEAWTTPVHLVFCRHSNNNSWGHQIVAHIFFRPPPQTPKVKLWRLIVRLVAADSPSHTLTDYVEQPTFMSSVSNASGFTHHEFRSLDFACSTNCKAYYAKVVGLSFTDHLHCSGCITSSTQEGCVYYPNGTAAHNGSTTGRAADCFAPPLLRAQTGCLPDHSYLILVPAFGFGIALMVSVALLLLIFYFRRRHCRGGLVDRRRRNDKVRGSAGAAVDWQPVSSMLPN